MNDLMKLQWIVASLTVLARILHPLMVDDHFCGC